MKKIKKMILTGLLSLSFMGTVLVFYPQEGNTQSRTKRWKCEAGTDWRKCLVDGSECYDVSDCSYKVEKKPWL